MQVVYPKHDKEKLKLEYNFATTTALVGPNAESRVPNLKKKWKYQIGNKKNKSRNQQPVFHQDPYPLRYNYSDRHHERNYGHKGKARYSGGKSRIILSHKVVYPTLDWTISTLDYVRLWKTFSWDFANFLKPLPDFNLQLYQLRLLG